MDFAQRVRLARRHVGLSQSQLAKQVGVQRSAVSQWESTALKFPSLMHLQATAVVTGVSFEWLATGRGRMLLDRDAVLESIPAAEGILVENPLECRLIRAFRRAPAKARVGWVEVVEALEVRGFRMRDTVCAVEV
ncbi:MAG: helix-turn-helix domain-containing protein [Chloroflexota bacterium]|nr:helix-turn-helix domain-containing protein [Chloroflexota bacterium]